MIEEIDHYFNGAFDSGADYIESANLNPELNHKYVNLVAAIVDIAAGISMEEMFDIFCIVLDE